jgi:hypothetical protein
MDRQSIYTVQGTEWVKGANFASYVKSAYAPQRCLTNGDLSCLDATVSRSEYDYLYVSKFPRVDCRNIEQKNAFHYFLESIHMEKQFAIAYESDGVVIFSR